jgi:hypothetical protein
MNFLDWSTFDIKQVPTDVLKEIYSRTHRELSKRRQMHAVSQQAVKAAAKFKPISQPHKDYHPRKLKELDALVEEDWSEFFQAGSNEPVFYVYAHVRPSKYPMEHTGRLSISLPGNPFYIGKGCGERAWDLKRNEGHGQELRQLKEMGVGADQIVHILKEGLTERQALELESKLIYFFGTKFEADRRGLLVNLTIPPRPH